MFLSANDYHNWQGAHLDWVEDRRDGAVEVIATRADGTSLALEHTLIQPFVGEKFDSEAFMKAFRRIDKNPLLVLPERNLDVIIPVNAIPNGYDWNDVGEALLRWLLLNHAGAPKEGELHCAVSVGSNPKIGELLLNITLRTTSVPGMAGNCLISRNKMPGDLASIVEKALRTKIPKLVRTIADKRILLLELEQVSLGDSQVYEEVSKLAPDFPEISKIDEVWFANTSILLSEGWACFTLVDGRGHVEWMTFENAVLKDRRDDRARLGPPKHQF